MPVSPDAVGAVAGPVERSWTEDDCMLYALGVGAGAEELAFTTENSAGVDLEVLPTFAVIVGSPVPGAFRTVGSFDPALLVHGEQSVELAGPLPPVGEVRVESVVTGVFDKGSGALIEVETTGVDPVSGAARFRCRSSAFVRGEGGFGGPRGPSRPPRLPERRPDEVLTYETKPDQALLYRLSGDRNPLHSDPTFAARAGFPRPILHGLCTYGFTGRALLHAMAGSAPERLVAMSGRFTRPVFPGDLLTVSMWAEGEEVRFRTETQRGEVVLDDGSARVIRGA